jgi:DNA-directed RNA polymerase specialized sigma24 family protein
MRLVCAAAPAWSLEVQQPGAEAFPAFAAGVASVSQPLSEEAAAALRDCLAQPAGPAQEQAMLDRLAACSAEAVAEVLNASTEAGFARLARVLVHGLRLALTPSKADL